MTRALIPVLGLAALTLAACDARRQEAPPADVAAIAAPPIYMQGGVPPQPLAAPATTAPAGSQSARAYLAREPYSYIDRAYDMSYAFDAAPPDYAFAYDGVDPWVWQASNGGYWMVEPLPVGERYYYYEPGTYQPFFVRDPDYSYAYRGGLLVQVYDSYGRPWNSGYTPWMTERAGRYRDRGQALWYASRRSPRIADYGGAWQARRPRLEAQQRLWAVRQQQDAGWRQWRNAAPARVERAVWERERVDRRNRWGRGSEPRTQAELRGARPHADAGRRGRDDGRNRFERERAVAVAPPVADQRRGWERQQRAQQDQERRGREQQQAQQQEQRRGWERQQRAQQDQERRGREQQQAQQQEQRRGWERQQRAQPEQQRRGPERQQRAQQQEQRRGPDRPQQAQPREQRREARGGGGGGPERQQVARNDRGGGGGGGHGGGHGRDKN